MVAKGKIPFYVFGRYRAYDAGLVHKVAVSDWSDDSDVFLCGKRSLRSPMSMCEDDALVTCIQCMLIG